jgi:hypothetical protein
MSCPSASTIPDKAAASPTPPPLLGELLRAHAAGLLAEAAAVDLLITHQHWLARPAFTDRFIHPVTSSDGRRTGAWIDWQAAITALEDSELPCSGSEASVLRIAASLGAGLPVALREVLGCLDSINIAAVRAAVTAANRT